MTWGGRSAVPRSTRAAITITTAMMMPGTGQPRAPDGAGAGAGDDGAEAAPFCTRTVLTSEAAQEPQRWLPSGLRAPHLGQVGMVAPGWLACRRFRAVTRTGRAGRD